MNLNIFISGHNGMVGSSIKRIIDKTNHKLITASRKELNLENSDDVNDFFRKEKIDLVINAAAKVGGILANKDFPYDFLMKNMKIQNNLIEASINNNVKRYIFLGSSCIYPKFAPQPIKEEHLLTGSLEPTNQWYAIAKISGILGCQAAKKQFGLNAISLMPTNLYGENDNFDLQSSHVLPAMIRKFDDAKMNNHERVSLWGTGNPFREFLHVDDMAKAVVFCIENELEYEIYNVGYGSDISIKDLALLIQKIVGHEGEIIWDNSKPDGTPKKLMDSSKLRKSGWQPEILLEDGILRTYKWYLQNKNNIRKLDFK